MIRSPSIPEIWGFKVPGCDFVNFEKKDDLDRHAACTVFIRIVAAATVNFAPSSARLLIEGGYDLFRTRNH